MTTIKQKGFLIVNIKHIQIMRKNVPSINQSLAEDINASIRWHNNQRKNRTQLVKKQNIISLLYKEIKNFSHFYVVISL